MDGSATVHVLARLNHELGTTIQVVAHDLNMLLPILTGAVYLLDGHPHYAAMDEVLDADLLTQSRDQAAAEEPSGRSIKDARMSLRNEASRSLSARNAVLSSGFSDGFWKAM